MKNGHQWASRASTQAARESAWRGFWPSDFAAFLLQTSRFYGWLRSGSSTHMMALTTRVSCCVFKVLGFNSNLFNFGPPCPGKLNPNGQAGPKLEGIGAFIVIHILFFYSWMIKLYLVTCFSCDNMTYI